MVLRKNLLRLIGFALLAVLLAKIDRGQFLAVLSRAALPLVLAAILLNIPGILIKSLRWRWLLSAQGIPYGVAPSTLAYFGSIFIGLLTPGRLGEFVKALHVSKDCGVSSGRAFSSVLADRLFDLYALTIVGCVALINLGSLNVPFLSLTIGAMVIALVLPPAMLINNRTFTWGQTIGLRMGKIGRKLVGPEGWLVEMREGLKQLSPAWTLLAVVLTILAYGVFYLQAYLLSVALHMDASVLEVSYAVALGSLVTLIPISISGIGTREAAVVAYLGAHRVDAEAALGFSLLVFATFYLGTGVIGSLAWIIKPVRWERGERVKLGEIGKAQKSGIDKL